ncbi:hypothetical protein [Marinobacter bohaiensis]|uniref:hypothetical protein n=1 Tax=Marinobacter bohaiensis TaxID=2201898 RepID=UPI0013A6C590|nr:hypothetical protein [Marinobacter bohaiensis]
MRLPLAVGSLALFLSGCATTTYHTDFHPVQKPYQQIYYNQGWTVLHQEGTQFDVELAVRESKERWEEITAFITVLNRSGGPVNIGIENITLTQDSQPIALWTYHELEQQHVTRAQSRKTAIALGAMAQSLSASQPTTTSTYGSGSVYGTGGSATYSGSSYSTTYDPAASAAAQAQIQANAQSGMANINADLVHGLSALQGYLQKTTILPENSFTARFRSHRTSFNNKAESYYQYLIQLPGEKFRFKFMEETSSETHKRKLF